MAIDRHHRQYKTKRDLMKRRWAADRADCHICGGKSGPIDYAGPPGAPLSCDLDHVQAISQGGGVMDISNWAPSHASCNRSKGARDLRAHQRAADDRRPAPIRRTTTW